MTTPTSFTTGIEAWQSFWKSQLEAAPALADLTPNILNLMRCYFLCGYVAGIYGTIQADSSDAVVADIDEVKAFLTEHTPSAASNWDQYDA